MTGAARGSGPTPGPNAGSNPLPDSVRETRAMIAGMAPRPVPGDVCFVTVGEAEVTALLPSARAMMREAEGVTLVLPLAHPRCPDGALALRQITLAVQSALDGVGLTAAVSSALAARAIPCNVIAGACHDHLFVPAARAEEAQQALAALADATG